MFAKMIALLMSKDGQEQLLLRIKENPRTSWMAVVVIVLWAGAAKLDESGLKMASMLVGGAGALLAFVTLLFAFDKPKDPPLDGK